VPHLIVTNPEGIEVGRLPAPLDRHALLRLVYGLGDLDHLLTMRVDDHWRLGVVWGSRPTLERVAVLTQHPTGVPMTTAGKAAEDITEEAAVWDLLDAGWVLKQEAVTG
jgi:hypothetical protein